MQVLIFLWIEFAELGDERTDLATTSSVAGTQGFQRTLSRRRIPTKKMAVFRQKWEAESRMGRWWKEQGLPEADTSVGHPLF